MQATVYSEIGKTDSIKNIELPMPQPKDNQVQIMVKATALSVSDFKSFTEIAEAGKVSFATKMLSGVNKPFGGDISGIVTKVGKNVKQFKTGDEVYSSIGISGGCAEYIAADAKKVFLKPTNLSFEEAAAIPTSGIVAMDACVKANIKPQASVLVYGASGGVGQFAVQIAKAMGGIVTAVCSTRNTQMAYSIGADNVIDYKKSDIAKCNMTFDAILGVNGNNSLSTYKKLLKPGGTYIAIGGEQATSGLIAPIYALGSGKKMSFVIYALAIKHGHLKTLKNMTEQGKIKPYIENTYLPDEIKTAIQTVCKNHVQGKVVISIKY